MTEAQSGGSTRTKKRITPRPDPRLFALARPGGPLASRASDRRSASYSNQSKEASPLSTQTPASQFHIRRGSPHTSPPISIQTRSSQYHSMHSSGAGSSSQRSPPQASRSSLRPLERQQHGDDGGAEQRPRPRSPVAYRNLKTLPSKPNEAVFRLHVNQLEVRENTKEPPVNTKQAQGNWHAPLVLERYGMGNTPGPNAPTPMDGVEGLETPQTSYVPQRGESLSLRVAQVTLRTPPASSRPETKPVPAHATVSPSDEAPSEVASTSHLGSESSRYHSLLDEVKEEDFGRLTERYNKLDDVADEILALNDKHDALSDKVDGVLEGTQELLEEVQSIKDNLSTMMGNMNSCQTSSDSSSRAPNNTGIPKRRREESLVLARSIRSYLAFLLGLEEACEAQILTSVTVDEANAFAKSRDVDCCTVDNFRIDLIGPPRSPWNMSAANVFVAAFEQFQGLEMDLKIVKDAFFTRLKTLKQDFKLAKKTKNEQKFRNTQKRRQMRKRTLFTQRYDIALQDPRLQRHLELLGRLGVDGMSSDESDEEDGSGPVFRVRRPNWRAPIVGRWLQVFDSVNLKRRQTTQDKRGCYPRIRVRNSSEPSCSKGFVEGLPMNAYDESWMARQSQVLASKDYGDFSHGIDFE